jgi:hypothetical protein
MTTSFPRLMVKLRRSITSSCSTALWASSTCRHSHHISHVIPQHGSTRPQSGRGQTRAHRGPHRISPIRLQQDVEAITGVYERRRPKERSSPTRLLAKCVTESRIGMEERMGMGTNAR